MDKKCRIGLIGLGFIGGLHARCIAEGANTELVAVADLNEKLANEVAELYGCKVYKDYNEMIAKEELDAVDICVPEDFHEAVACDVANAKKDFIIEKPLAKTYAGCKQITDAVKVNGVRMMVAHVMKFDPRYAELKDSIRKGELGEITSMNFKCGNPVFTANRLKGKISFFYYLGIHDLEIIMDYNLPAKPVRVYAQGSSKKNAHMNDLDTAQTVITFDNGSIATFQVGWAYPNNSAMGILRESEVIGTKGVGDVRISDQGIRVMTEEAVSYPDTLHWPEYNGKIQGDLPAELDHFAVATMEGKPYIVGDVAPVYACAVAEAALKSIEINAPVELKL